MLREESERDQLIANAIQVGMGYEKTQSLLKSICLNYMRETGETLFLYGRCITGRDWRR